MTFEGRSWRFIKLNPLFSIAAIILFFLGILLLIISPMTEWESDSDSITIGSGGFSTGRELRPGAELEITYTISGGRADVYFVKGTGHDFEYNDEHVIEYVPESTSGIIRYTVTEQDVYKIHFNGEDFSVSYTYKVRTPWLSFFILITGIVIIIQGVLILWIITHFKNPKYFGDSIKYFSIIIVILLSILIMGNYLFREDPSSQIMTIVLIIFVTKH